MKKRIRLLYGIAGGLALTAGLLLLFLLLPPLGKQKDGAVTKAPGLEEAEKTGGENETGGGTDGQEEAGSDFVPGGSAGMEENGEQTAGEGMDKDETTEGGETVSGQGEPEADGKETADGGTKSEQNNFSAFSMVFFGDTYYNERREANYRNAGIGGLLGDDLISLIRDSDLAVLNNECALSTGGVPMSDKEYTYHMKPELAESYADLGIDLATLANNHALDFGTEALSDTFRTLDSYGIDYIGAGEDYERAKQPAVYELGGRTVAVLAASRVIPVVEWNIINRAPGMFCTYDSKVLEEEIRSCKEKYDYVIVYVHWGVMEMERPEEYQRSMAYRFVDAGADLVMGTHPHVVQSIEFYKGRPIYYSLGNFLYGSTIRRTMLLSAEVDETGELRTRIDPCYAENGKTMRMTEENGKEFYRYMEQISYSVEIDDKGYVKESEDGRTEESE